MSNVSIAVRIYGSGRICIAADRLSGFLTNHGFGSRQMWRNLLEWTGQKLPSESINLAIVESFPMPTLDFVNAFGQITYQKIDLQYILDYGLSGFDLVYFIGLPPIVPTPVADALAAYVSGGGGMLIEVPDISAANINVLASIEDIYCASNARPVYTQAYWTVDGLAHTIYDKNADLYFYTALESNAFSNSWTVLLNDVLVPSAQATGSTTAFVPTTASASSEFGFSYYGSFVNGVVILDEDFLPRVDIVSLILTNDTNYTVAGVFSVLLNGVDTRYIVCYASDGDHSSELPYTLNLPAYFISKRVIDLDMSSAAFGLVGVSGVQRHMELFTSPTAGDSYNNLIPVVITASTFSGDLVATNESLMLFNGTTYYYVNLYKA